MKLPRELRHKAFRENRFAAEQRSTSSRAVAADAIHRTADGWALVADVARLFANLEEQHEFSAATDANEVLGYRDLPEGGCELRSFTLALDEAPSSSLADQSAVKRPPSPETIPATAPLRAGEGPSRGVTSVSVLPALDEQAVHGEVVRDRILADKDTQRVRSVLVGWRDKKIRTYQDVQRQISGAHDPDRVRSMIVNITPDWEPTPLRRGQVKWDDVDGIRGYLPYAEPVMAVGTIAVLHEHMERRLKVALSKVSRHADGYDLPFLRSGKRLVQLSYESPEVGERICLFRDKRPVRMKLLVRRELQLGGKCKVILADLYAEDWPPGERDRRMAWVAQELLRDPPDEPGWRDPLRN